LPGSCAHGYSTIEGARNEPSVRSSADVTARLRPLRGSRFCRVSTLEPGDTRRDTTTRVAFDGDRLLVRAPATSDLAARVWRSTNVTIAPCTRRGRMLAAPVDAAARVVAAAEEPAAEAALATADRPLERLRLWLDRRRGLDLLYVEIVPAS